MSLLAYVGNDNTLKLDGLRDADGAYVNDATVSCTGVADSNGNSISGDTFPKTLAYVATSNGNYRGTLQQSLALVDGESYVATITVDGAGLQATFSVPFEAERRTTR